MLISHFSATAVAVATATIVATLLLCHSADSADIAGQFLGPHNVVRTALRLPPLSWDARLAKYAKWYGGTMRKTCAMVHSGGPYGENLFWGSGGGGWTPAQAVASWVAEQRWYRYGTDSCPGGGDCGHYTQMVWRKTKRVGCAVVTCNGRRGVLIVCEYDPPGNYIGEKPY